MLKRCILCGESQPTHLPSGQIHSLCWYISYLQNLEILTDGWYSLWTQHTLFYPMPSLPAM